MEKKALKSIEYLKGKNRILFLNTSNRWAGHKELPKSTALAKKMAAELGNVEVIDVPTLMIHPCDGNISARVGNECGLKEALLKDKTRNPSGNHRCWVNFNTSEDELWKISQPLLACDCVVFFASVRWGQTNSIHQKLIERLSWIENRHSTLGEDNILKGIDAGIILTGHNWRGEQVLNTQKDVLKYFGFNVVDELCWNWQFTTPDDESGTSYLEAIAAFDKELLG